MRKKKQNDYEAMIPYLRGLIGYLWIVVSFGCIILLVQASFEEKEIRVKMGKKNFEKMHVLDEIRQVDNRIKELERYERIAAYVEENLPQLGPPSHPAIEIPVAGLRDTSRFPVFRAPPTERNYFISQLRDQWNKTEGSIRSWIQSLWE